MREFVLAKFRDYSRSCLLFGLFLSPVVFSRETQDVFNLLKLTVLWAAGILAVAFFVAWSSERGVWPPLFRLMYLSAGFLVAAAIATILSQNTILSTFGLYHRYGGLIPFLLYAVIAFVIVGLYWESPQGLREIAKASAWASFLLTSYVLVQAAGADWIDWKDGSGKTPPFPVGTMGNSNFAGGYLGIGLPFVIYLAATAKQYIHRIALYSFLALDIVALWFTQTRGGMIAAGVGVFTMAVLYRDKLPRWARISTYAGMGVAALIAVLVLWHPGMPAPPGPLARFEAFRTGTFQIRTLYWQTGLRIFAENPIFGTGLEQYYANYPRFRLPTDGALLGLTITDKPHNIFVEYLANSGVVGLAAYLAMVGGALWFGFRASPRAGEEKILLVAFMGVLAGYLGQGFFSIDVPPIAVMGWVGVAGIAALADPRLIEARNRVAAEEPERKTRGKKIRKVPVEPATPRIKRHGPTMWPVHAGAFVFAVVLLMLGSRPLRADVVAKESLVMQTSQGAGEDVFPSLDRAIELNPVEANYYSQAGAWAETLAQRSADPEEKKRFLTLALRYYNQALDLQGGNIFFLINIARVHTTWAQSIDPGRFPLAETKWKIAVEHDPTDWQVHNSYALMLGSYVNAKPNDRSIKLRTAKRFEEVVRIKPDLLEAWINLGRVYVSLEDLQGARRALERAKAIDATNADVLELEEQIGG